MKFKREMLQDIVYDDCAVAERIEDDVIGNSRWSINHVIIFKYRDKFYKSYYSVGATETQCENPYEYENDEIECPEVEQKEVKVMEWVVKE
jgi:hypothetical protein